MTLISGEVFDTFTPSDPLGQSLFLEADRTPLYYFGSSGLEPL